MTTDDKHTTGASEAARRAYNQTDWPGSASFYPSHLRKANMKAFDIQGTLNGGLDSSKSNESSKPKAEYVHTLQPKTGIEMTPGKKYLLIVDVSKCDQATIKALGEASLLYESEFRQRGLDVTFLATMWPMSVYELEGAPCQKEQSSNVSQ